MKRLFSLILAACMLVGALVYIAPSGIAADDYIPGDADKNGEVDMRDILTIRRYLAALIGEDEISIDAADVDKKHNDGDNRITLDDVIRLRRYFVGLDELDEDKPEKTNPVDSITIGGVNIKNFTIVIPDKSIPVMNYSSDRLRSYIYQACGVNLNITDDESSVSGPMIKYVYDTDNKYELGKEGYRVAVEEDGNVIFTCGSMRGPLYVTYFFLEEHVGWRFLSSKQGEFNYLYEAENIDIPIGYQAVEVPVFEYRATRQAGINSQNFEMLKINAGDGGAGSGANAEHGWVVGTLFMHAHSYEVQCGISNQEQPCLTSEETYNKIVKYNIDLIEERESWGQHLGETWTQIACSPNDNTNFCKCANCTAVYKQEGSIAGTVFRLANRVAETLGEKYPGIEIFTIAYWDARKPPKMTRPLDNICVCYCIGGCNNHPYDHPEECEAAGGNERLQYVSFEGKSDGPSANNVELGYYEDWLELTNNIYIWYYSSTYAFPMAPSPILFNVYNDIKYIASSGARGVFFEGSGGQCSSSFEILKAYMAAKMNWHPFMSEEEYNDLFNEFLMIYYGDGWQYIREYIEMSHHAGDLNGCWTNNYDRPWNMYNEEYFAEHYDEMSELFDKALAATSDTEQRRRIARSRAHCDYLGLSATYEDKYVNGDSASRAVYEERYARLYNTILDRGDTPGACGDIIPIFSSSGTAGCEAFPSSESDIKCPMDWIFREGFSGYWEWDEDQHRWM